MGENKEDKFQQELKVCTQKLQECQSQKETKSCFTCKKVLECPTRKEYVNSVYNSMSKGESGGFEF
ncbi:MAG: hypothetical protein KGV58_00475 [Campylobacteraceae bacterium]|nr:hypothetical protein [Campylobacteraceae bacterium]